MTNLTDVFEKNKKWLCFALAVTFIWGMLTHGYGFMDSNFSHDSLAEWDGLEYSYEGKMTKGRVFVPFYHGIFRGMVTVPWLVGCVSLLWLGLAVFFVLRSCDIKSPIIAALASGIFTTNISLSALGASYLHDFDCNSFAIMSATAAVYLWRMDKKWGLLLGAGFVCLSLGIYQTYVFLTAALVMIISIMELLNGSDWKSVFFRGIKAVAMVALGGILYLIAMNRVLSFFGLVLEEGGDHSLLAVLRLSPEAVPELFADTYETWFETLKDPFNMYPTVNQERCNKYLLALIAVALGVKLLNKQVGLMEKLLCVLLVVLLPFIMNMIHLLTLGKSHELTVYPIWMTYLLALLLSDDLAELWKEGKLAKKIGLWQNWLCMFAVLCLLGANVQFANGMYLRKDMEHDAYLSLMNRVVMRMEMEEAYVPGETPVVFVGMLKDGDSLLDVIPGFASAQYTNQYISGFGHMDTIGSTWRRRMNAYFTQVMGLPINLVDDPQWGAIQESEEAAQMPYYPEEGFIQFQDGVMIVKLGETG